MAPKKKSKQSGTTIKKRKFKEADLGQMSVDDFFSMALDENQSLETSSEHCSTADPSETVENEAINSNEEASDDEVQDHKSSLANLKNLDPDFYKFLQENDKKLLDFNLSDDEGDENEDSEGLHTVPDRLEVASDESDLEEDLGTGRDSSSITLKMLKKWQEDIMVDKTNKTISALAQAFQAALVHISPDDQDQMASVYTVTGGAIFNGVMQICVLELGPAIRRYLDLNNLNMKTKPIHKLKKFSKINTILKGYFTNLIKLLNNVSSANIQTVLLKHLHYMLPLMVPFTKLQQTTLKSIITKWGTATEDRVRVVAFFCILRLLTNHKNSTSSTTQLYEVCLKTMYMTYVKNSKFISTTTLAGVNFMRRSLIEIFSMNLDVSYQHVFLYIRQLAIHLRNAITIHKKENLNAVYNWQFVNSLKLWSGLVSSTYGKSNLIDSLLYPLVQICFGALKLVPTVQYYPLRFHLIDVLIGMSRATTVFIPVLPFLLDVLVGGYDFNKKHTTVSMKPVLFTCILRSSKSQMSENGFKDAVLDAVYSLVLEYLELNCCSVAFPDLVVLPILQMKSFLKSCKNLNYKRKIKQLIEKIEENTKFIQQERTKLNCNLNDTQTIQNWEIQLRHSSTTIVPIAKFYSNWQKVQTANKQKLLTECEKIADYKLPNIIKINKKLVQNKSENNKSNDSSGNDNDQIELFPSESEEDDTTIQNADDKVEKKRERGKRAGSKNSQKCGDVKKPKFDPEPIPDTNKDLVHDFNLDDW